MTNLKTKYMGIKLETPLVAAASSVSSMLDSIKKVEQAGAGALVIRSLFEEQIQFNAQKMEDALSVGAYNSPESLDYFPKIEHGGADEHLMWIEKTRAEVKLPLIASLNAISPGAWTEYAKRLEDTGVDGLELNVYNIPADPKKTSADIESELFEIVDSVVGEVKIPVSVKLSPFYTGMANVAHRLEEHKVSALVLFNRFLQPDIDVEEQAPKVEMTYSTAAEMRLPLRWVGLLFGRVKVDLALNTGVHSGRDAAKAFLAGATIVQTASALLKNGIPYLSTMLRDLEAWMEEAGYESLEDFRGKLSQKETLDPLAFERAQYVKLLMSQ
jgi:dihydroorotate dehydrogenase (fumarate)